MSQLIIETFLIKIKLIATTGNKLEFLSIVKFKN